MVNLNRIYVESVYTKYNNFTFLFIPCILLSSYCLKDSNNMHHTFNDLKNYYKVTLMFRPISVAATTIIRESSSL
jgi:hypothetical protein